MRYAWVLVLVLGCDGANASGPMDAPRTDPAVCLANREAAIDRSCNVASDCVLVTSADCCGPIDIAVHVGTEGAFPPVEAAYEACLACPPAGCAHQLEAEDGTPIDGRMIVATCAAGHCKSIVQ